MLMADRYRFQSEVAWLFSVEWAMVVKIEDIGYRPCVDLEMPASPWFVCDQVLTHNSYFMLEMSRCGYKLGTGSPLVATFEMKPFQCVRRLVALETGVSATMIRLGRLSHWGRERVAEGVDMITGWDERPFFIMEGGLRTTVEDLGLRVQELRPNALYVDGAYLLRTRSKVGAKWERIAETAEVLKMIAGEFNIPVIETYQFNRRGPGSMGNIGGSDAVGQLASIVIALDDEQQGGHSMWAARQFKVMKLLKGREGERGTIRVLYDMEKMVIAQHEVLSGYEDDNNEEERGVGP